MALLLRPKISFGLQNKKGRAQKMYGEKNVEKRRGKDRRRRKRKRRRREEKKKGRAKGMEL